jgi:hypothetical protein
MFLAEKISKKILSNFYHKKFMKTATILYRDFSFFTSFWIDILGEFIICAFINHSFYVALKYQNFPKTHSR